MKENLCTHSKSTLQCVHLAIMALFFVMLSFEFLNLRIGLYSPNTLYFELVRWEYWGGSTWNRIFYSTLGMIMNRKEKCQKKRLKKSVLTLYMISCWVPGILYNSPDMTRVLWHTVPWGRAGQTGCTRWERLQLIQALLKLKKKRSTGC